MTPREESKRALGGVIKARLHCPSEIAKRLSISEEELTAMSNGRGEFDRQQVFAVTTELRLDFGLVRKHMDVIDPPVAYRQLGRRRERVGINSGRAIAATPR